MDIIKKINEIAVTYFEDNNSKFAAALGTNEANIRNYRSKIVPKVEFIVKLCNDLDISFEWMFNDSGEMKKVKKDANVSLTYPVVAGVYPPAAGISNNLQHHQGIPLYEMNPAGNLFDFFNQPPNIIDYIQIPKLPKSDGALYILGESMYPLLKSGDIVIYKKINNLKEGIYYGEMYLLSIHIDGDDATLLRYVHHSEKGEDYIRLISHNTTYAPKDISMEYVRAMALIKAGIRINTMM
ncbi:phage repressor protein C with HTH and peptisase S24 domain [Pedobacter cryoconitis]|uniref:Phage repressor protein C with HTH and peptisase S24 domain n=1 Tax=Pedobacter cryoconitis TaxID=188932 RepID=A0A7W8YWU6_9SPHI|nr:S24 family peptidase [Pedobacter cryoconitis]MBB5623277.1 phage repressor protein C with HTH and peptisase S24 domain [Pedobacter cryoconitis]